MSDKRDFRLYPLLPVAVMLMLGIVAGDSLLPWIPPVAWGAVMIFLLVLIAVFPMRPLAQSVSILLATCCFGAWLTEAYEKSSRVELPDERVSYEAVVTSEPQRHGKVWRCDLLIVNVTEPLKVRASVLRDTLSGEPRHLHVGDGIVASSVLQPPIGMRHDSGFNYNRWLQVHGYKALTFIYNNDWTYHDVSLRTLSAFQRTRLAALNYRQRLVNRLSALGISGDQLALLSAMALGEKSSLSSSVRQDYALAGGSHILALSGLHLGILYAVLLYLMSLLTRPLFLRNPNGYLWRHVMTQTVTLIAIWCYVVLVGMSASVLRSACMLTVYGLSTLLNRQHFSLNSLALAAIVMLVFNPLNLWDVGFQLSFLSVLGILLLVRRHINWLVDLIWVSVAAQVCVAPLVIYYFGRFPTYFLLTNLIVIPCATLILYGALLLALFCWLPAVQGAVSWLLSHVLMLMNQGVSLVVSLPGSSISCGPLTWQQTAAIYLLMFCVYRIICLTLHPR